MAEDVVDAGATATPAAEHEQATFDLEGGVNEISESLGFGKGNREDRDTADDPDDTADQADDVAQADADPKAPASDTDKAVEKAAAKLEMPKSWARETQEIWDEMTPRAQEQYLKREQQMLEGLEQYKGDSGFGKQMREVLTPYKAMLQSQGVDEPKAVQFLLNAHYRLSTAQPAERQAYFAHLAKSYGIDLAGMQPAADAPQVDPTVKALQEKVNTLESSMTAREQAALNEAKAKVASEVEAFSKDPKHQYFYECSDDIVALIQAGHTLEQAYEKAVYANPVTRAKELSRLQAEQEKTLREKSRTDAEAARKAAATNVRSRDTRRAPTEPKGSMEDTMRATLKTIRERTH